jgi:hypothetical protein
MKVPLRMLDPEGFVECIGVPAGWARFLDIVWSGI